jgi:hypothetical protein
MNMVKSKVDESDVYDIIDFFKEEKKPFLNIAIFL